MTEFVAGNIFVRDCFSPHDVGWSMEGHAHNFDHVTMIHAGAYRCRRWAQAVNDKGMAILDGDGQPVKVLVSDETLKAPHWLLIKANMFHSFECIEGPGTLWCMYSHRDPQTEEVVQNWTGWMDAVR